MRTVPALTVAMTVALAVCAAPATAVQIDVTTDPPLDAANLARNADMEAGAGGRPADWAFSTAIPENFTVDWTEGSGRDGSRAVHLIAHDNVMSGYWNQAVRVAPGDYLFRGFYRTVSGRILIYAHGRNTEIEPPIGVDVRAYHGSSVASFLVPVFIPWEALTGPDPDTYYPFEVKVTIPEGLPAITLSMGLYFTPGEVWFDDVWFGPATVGLKLHVTGEGEPLEKVTVFQDGVEDPVYSSAADPTRPAGRPLVEPFEVTVPNLPVDGTYLIVAKSVAGEVYRVRFPEEAQ